MPSLLLVSSQKGTKLMVRKLIILCVAALIVGCAATGPAYEEAPLPKGSDVLVYIYRPSNFTLGGRDAYFYVNDVNVVDLSNNGYTWFHVPAGEYSFKHKWPADITFGKKDIVIPVKWAPRERVYYRLLLEYSYGYPNVAISWNVSQVPESQALEEIKNCKLQNSFGVNELLRQINQK